MIKIKLGFPFSITENTSFQKENGHLPPQETPAFSLTIFKGVVSVPYIFYPKWIFIVLFKSNNVAVNPLLLPNFGRVDSFIFEN